MLAKYCSLILMLLSTPCLVFANIYRSVDANGVVLYSDAPATGSEKIELSPLSATKMREHADAENPEATAAVTPVEAVAPWPYNELSITQPTAEKTLHHIGGTLAIEVVCQPRLYPGDVLQLALDGVTVLQQVENNQPLGSNVDLTATVRFSMTIPNVWRGNHTVQASILRDGKTLLASTSVPFFVKQNSILIPKQ